MRLVSLVFAFIVGVSFCHGLEIVKDGKAQASIYCAANALPGEREAAKELCEYFRKISGASVPVVNSEINSGIVLGTVSSAHAPKEIRQLLEGRNDESFIIKSNGDKLYIVGKTQVGTYFGAVTLLSDYYNVRWFYPGEGGEYVEKRTDIVVPEVDRLEEPAFRWRVLSQTSCGGRAESSHRWAARNRLQAPPAFSATVMMTGDMRQFYDARLADGIATEGGHLTYYHVAPPSKYLDTHPEFFALHDGKRSRNRQHNDTHHCLSNPQLQEMVVDYICNLNEKFGKRITFLFGGPDNVKGWCECDGCRALDVNGTFDVSHRFHTVAQSIAKRVYERFPDAQMETWAYANYRTIPKDVAIDSRMAVYFCSHSRCFAHTLDDPSCPRNVSMLKLIKQWMALNPKLHLYEYAHCTPMHWTPIEKTLAHDLRLFKNMGILGWKEEITFPDSAWPAKPPTLEENPDHGAHRFGQEWLYWNVAARLTWNPDLDVEDVIADLESKYYGKAYAAMKLFNDKRRGAWDSCQGCFGYPTGDERTARLLMKDGLREELLSLLDKADAAARDDATLTDRLHRDRIYFKHYWCKANDAYREREGNLLTAPEPASPIVIDGKDDDPAWAGACYTTQFRSISKDAEPMPEQLKTSVGIMADDANFYFLVQAREPHPEKLKAIDVKDGPLWNDDSFEILLDPMNMANAYYQVIVNSKGTVFDCRQSGADARVDFGVEAAATVLQDRYVIEIKVPVKKMEGVFGRGSNWKIQFARNRYVEDGLQKGCFTLYGALPHNRGDYRTISIGRPLLKNGDFMQPDKKYPNRPSGWELNGNCEYRASGTPQAAVAMKQGAQCYQLLWDWKGPLGQSEKERPIRIIFRASGTGTINVFGTRYNDDWSGPKLKRKNLGTARFGSFELTPEPRTFEARYTILPDEWIGLFFSLPQGNAILENVAILFQ